MICEGRERGREWEFVKGKRRGRGETEGRRGTNKSRFSQNDTDGSDESERTELEDGEDGSWWKDEERERGEGRRERDGARGQLSLVLLQLIFQPYTLRFQDL